MGIRSDQKAVALAVSVTQREGLRRQSGLRYRYGSAGVCTILLSKYYLPLDDDLHAAVLDHVVDAPMLVAPFVNRTVQK